MRNITREQEILDLLHDHDVVQVTDLVAALGVSEATVRRDLASMEERGLLSRVHGGATLTGIARREPLFHDKEGRNTSAKKAIANVAVGLIDNGDTVYRDGGSTVLQLAKLLDRRLNLTIVTNSLMAASSLMDTDHRLILVGGEFRKLSRTLVGTLTAPVIRSLHVDKAFMGTIGFTIQKGMSTTDPNEAYTKDLVMASAGQVILLADSTKLGVSSFACCDRPGDLDLLITDAIDPEMQQALEARDIRVLVAGGDRS